MIGETKPREKCYGKEILLHEREYKGRSGRFSDYTIEKVVVAKCPDDLCTARVHVIMTGANGDTFVRCRSTQSAQQRWVDYAVRPCFSGPNANAMVALRSVRRFYDSDGEQSRQPNYTWLQFSQPAVRARLESVMTPSAFDKLKTELETLPNYH